MWWRFRDAHRKFLKSQKTMLILSPDSSNSASCESK
jgi:hypothetical protein